MTLKDGISNRYFEWMYDLVCEDRYSESVSYRKLLTHLHNIEFTYSIPRDGNRANDGEKLRYRFALLQDCEELSDYLDDPCSVLEMMIALAIRVEENIMSDPEIGDRTSQWFWDMIVNLGLGDMMDRHYDRRYVDDVIWRFLNREYEPDGKGGLFRIRDCERDLRDVEIWCQFNYYINTII